MTKPPWTRVRLQPFRTVADVIADLQKMPQAMPVLVGCHFDNDDGLTRLVEVNLADVAHSEAEFFLQADPADPGSFKAVTIS